MATPSGSEASAQAVAAAKAFTDAPATDLSGNPGVQVATAGGETAAISGSANVDLNALNGSGQAATPHIDTIILTGNANLNATGDQHDNLIVGNDGNNNLQAGDGHDTVLTGDGADTIMLGDGNDTIIIDGSGTKNVNGGAGDDHFVIADSSASHQTFTGLNIGDRLTVTVPDGNADGVLDFSDVSVTGSNDPASASLTYHLSNGSSFTLDGVPLDAATNGSVNYEVVDNGDGTWTVDITG
jgi:Ca2+-binding RTX toxin-like protein